MPVVQIDLAITVETALNVGGSGTLGTLADKNLLRDAWDRPLLPGSQVKGRVRHACEALARALYPHEPICHGPQPERTCPQDPGVIASQPAHRRCLICQLFGSTFWPSPLQFQNLVYDPDCQPPVKRTERFDLPQEVRPGIGIERRRRTVQEELLFFTETTPPGLRPTFRREAAIRGVLPSKRHAALLAAGLLLCNRWGAAKSRGLGWSTLALRVIFDGTSLLDSLGDPAITMNWEVLHG